MNDDVKDDAHDDAHDDRAGTPGDDVDLEVRALLADARVTTPMPADVAARLDEVLAGLPPLSPAERSATQPSTTEGSSAVTDLSAARARRVRRPWLGAAAAAVVLVTAGVTLPGLLADDDPTSIMATEVQDTTEAPRDAAPGPQPGADEPAPDGAAPLALTRDGLAAEVEAVLVHQLAALPVPATGALEDEAPAGGESGSRTRGGRLPMAEELNARDEGYEGTAALPPPCTWTGLGTQVAATLDGEPATLVTRRTAAGTVVRVVTCPDGDPVVTERLRLDVP